MRICNNKIGFTLAEVLITLGIIGVVAAITIPILMNNIQDQQYKTAYKKAFSVASQAWISAVNDNTLAQHTSASDTASIQNNFNVFMSKFIATKICPAGGDNSTCWPSGDLYYSAHPTTTAPAFIDTSGFCWAFCYTCAGEVIFVDTNGFKQPNKWGQDRFILPTVNISGGNTGDLVKIIPVVDTGYNINLCPSGNIHPCYSTSWLYGEN